MSENVVTPAFVRVWGAGLAAFTALGVGLVAIPLYARDELAARDFEIGVAVGAASVTAVLFGPASGRVADRRGRRSVAVAGGAIMLAAFLALLLDPPLAPLVAIRLAAGVGEAALVISVFTIVADLAPPERRGEAMSLITVAAYGGLALGPVVADAIVADGRFWPAWALGAVLTGAAAIGLAAGQETRPAGDEPAPRSLLPPRGALAPALLLLLALLGFGGFNAFVALYARELDTRPGLVFALFGLLVLFVRAAGRKIPDRLGARPTAGAACVAIAAGLVVIGAWQSVPGLFLGTAIFALGQSLAYPAIVLLAMARTPARERSAAVAAVSAAVDVALAAGAFALGAVAEVWDYGGAFLASAAVAAAGLLVLGRLRAAPPPAPAGAPSGQAS